MKNANPTVIAQISDLHCGSYFYKRDLAQRTIEEVNQLAPDVVVVTGDLSDMGLREQFEEARRLLDGLECPRTLIIPGNHDARNVGEVHFEELFGPRNSELSVDGVRILGLDSSEPDLDNGRIGRERYLTIEDRFSDPDEFKVVCIHHHLVPVPGTGRERNIVLDAGDLLRCLTSAGVDVVLCGHKHVPNVWRLEDLFIVNAGTPTGVRLRGRVQSCYNVIEILPGRVRVTLCHPFGDREVVADFSKAHQHACRWRPVIDLVEEESA